MDGSILCNDCDKRDICHSLCPEAELYAAQDNEEWTETPVSFYRDGEELRVFDSDSGYDVPAFSPIQKKIGKMLFLGFTRQIIAEKLSITTNSVYLHIHKMKKKIFPL